MFKPYKYVKEETPSEKEEVWEINIHLPAPQIDFRRWASAVLVASGLFLIANQILLPWLTTPPAQKPLLKPTAPEVLAEESGIRVEFEFTELKREPSVAVGSEPKDIPKIFYITIPKLGIEKAEVETNSESLSPDENLGHYAGSALPGEVGNTFIYGHSVLPMFFSPEDYRTIFSTLDKLEKGDEVILEFGGNDFKYVVEKLIVLNPEDVRPLEPVSPSFLRQSYLTLMTCVPPGMRTKRLLVQARHSSL